ncbi:MAG: alanine:cation symporter family protein [Paracoccus sp.]|nr:alanine:cation symporter family protein [Paracoccus sp. (in: a-proteobacteria)]
MMPTAATAGIVSDQFRTRTGGVPSVSIFDGWTTTTSPEETPFSTCAVSSFILPILPTGATGADLASSGFATALPGFGGLVVLVALVLFSYTTMLTWCFYGEKSFEYLAGRRAVLPYRFVFLLVIPVGAVGGLQEIWQLADTLNGLMAAPNLIALFALGRVVAQERTKLLSRKDDAADG